MLVSDGFDIYCPNDQCGLTILTRLERLANTSFFSYDKPIDLHETHESVVLTDDPYFMRPFLPILQPRFWGEAVGSLEHVLLNKPPCSVSIATFLVEPLFRDLLDCISAPINYDNLLLRNIAHFYNTMQKAMQHRDYRDAVQNRAIKEFIWALGIEALQEDVIDKLMMFEQSTGWTEDTLFPYAYMISHPNELTKELGVHPLESRAIALEFRRRMYEFYDIFSYYLSHAAVNDLFRDIRTVTG